FSIERKGGGVPVLHRDQASGECLLIGAATECVDRSMARGAVPETLNEVRAPVPLRVMAGVGLERSLAKIKGSPADEQRPIVVGKAELVLAVRHVERCNRGQAREDRIG